MKAAQRKRSRFRDALLKRTILQFLRPALEKAVKKVLRDMLHERVADHVTGWKQRAAENPEGHEAMMMTFHDIEAEAKRFLLEIDRMTETEGAV